MTEHVAPRTDTSGHTRSAPIRVGIVGATGYSGAIAAQLLARHPGFELAFCTSDARRGESVGEQLGVAALLSLAYSPNDAAETLAAGVDAVLLATPASVSGRLAPALFARGKAVIDFSGAFRLETAETYLQWYHEAHPHPELLAAAHYGLPELFPTPDRGEAGLLIANPGCFATAAQLALAPLVREGLVEPSGIIIDAKSGVSGAGRQAKEEYSFVEVDEDARAYRLLSHQHTPEIARHLGRAAGTHVSRVTFTPHLLPCKRGILATCYARPRHGATAADCTRALEKAYSHTPFVTATAPERVTLARVVGTQRACVGVAMNSDVVIAMASLDNLLKGAAGQAVQTLNLVYRMNETLGLDHLLRTAP